MHQKTAHKILVKLIADHWMIKFVKYMYPMGDETNALAKMITGGMFDLTSNYVFSYAVKMPAICNYHGQYISFSNCKYT